MWSNIGKEGGAHSSKWSSHMIEYLYAALFTHVADLIAATGVRCYVWI